MKRMTQFQQSNCVCRIYDSYSELMTLGPTTFDLKTYGLKTFGLKTSGPKTSGLKTSGLKTSGLKSFGLKTFYFRTTHESKVFDSIDSLQVSLLMAK